MMRYFSLSAIVLLLTLCGSISAQQRLVLHDDQNDPCRRFKMRILIPPDVVDRQLPVKRFSGGIDSKMVWNPCSEATPQIASVFPKAEPNRNDLLRPQLPFSFQRGTAEKNPKPTEFVFAPPRFTFPRIWRQP